MLKNGVLVILVLGLFIDSSSAMPADFATNPDVLKLVLFSYAQPMDVVTKPGSANMMGIFAWHDLVNQRWEVLVNDGKNTPITHYANSIGELKIMSPFGALDFQAPTQSANTNIQSSRAINDPSFGYSWADYEIKRL